MDVVLHQAAIPSVPRSVADPLTSHRANVDATLAVLVAAREAGVRRVVYAASSSAYGDTPELPKREDMVPNPLSPYALQKLIGRAVPPAVHAALWAGHRQHSLLQRLRAASGSLLALFGRDRAVCDAAAGGTAAAHHRRRRADPRLHVRRQRRRWRPEGGGRPGCLRARDQRRHRTSDLHQPACPGDSAPARLEPCPPVSPRRAQEMCATRSRISGWPGRCWDTNPGFPSKKASVAPSTGIAPQPGRGQPAPERSPSNGVGTPPRWATRSRA